MAIISLLPPEVIYTLPGVQDKTTGSLTTEAPLDAFKAWVSFKTICQKAYG